MQVGWLTVERYSKRHLVAQVRSTNGLHSIFKFSEILGSTLYAAMTVDKSVPVYNKYFFKLNLWVSRLSIIAWWICLLVFVKVAEDDYSLAVLCCLMVAKLIVEVQVLAQGSTCGIYGGQSDYWVKFSFTLGFSPATYHFSNASYFSVFRSWYSMHVEVCSIKFLSLATLLQLTNLPAWLGRQQSAFFVRWSL